MIRRGARVWQGVTIVQTEAVVTRLLPIRKTDGDCPKFAICRGSKLGLSPSHFGFLDGQLTVQRQLFRRGRQ